MDIKANKVYRYLLPTALVTGIVIILFARKPSVVETSPRDYDSIAREGTLRVTIERNSVSFHAEEDTFSGFDYTLIHAFAKSKGLKLEIIPEMSHERRVRGLEKGRYDIIACGMIVNQALKDSLLFTSPLALDRLVLVRRKADSANVKSPLDLAKHTLHVVKGSPATLRIRNLEEEIGDTIRIEETTRCGQERLMSLVAHGDIDFAVCDESIAQAALDSFPTLSVNTPLGFTQFYAWAVSKKSPALLDSLNTWIKVFKDTKEYKELLRKYHSNIPS